MVDAHLVDLGQVLRDPGDLHGREVAALVEVAAPRPRVAGAVPVHVAERVAGVLGEEDDAGPGVHRDRLVREPTHALDRTGVAVVDRVDLEHVAVLHAVDHVLGLLAREPRAPRRRATGAVPDGPREAGPVPPHPVVGGERDGRGAAVLRAVVDAPLADRHGRGPLHVDGPGVELVVPDQVGAAVRRRERSHAVVGAGHRLAQAQRVDEVPREDLVAEARRQIEQAVRIGDERAVARRAGRPRARWSTRRPDG